MATRRLVAVRHRLAQTQAFIWIELGVRLLGRVRSLGLRLVVLVHLTLEMECDVDTFRPDVTDADVGAAVFLDDRCIVWLTIKADGDQMNDQVRAEALLRDLLGLKAK